MAENIPSITQKFVALDQQVYIVVWNPWGIITHVDRRPVTAQDLMEAGLPPDFFGELEQPRLVEVGDENDEARTVAVVGQEESLEVSIQQSQLPALPWYDQGLDLPPEDEQFPMGDGTTHPAAYSPWMEEDNSGHLESTPTEPELSLFPDPDDEPLVVDLDLGDLAEDQDTVVDSSASSDEETVISPEEAKRRRNYRRNVARNFRRAKLRHQRSQRSMETSGLKKTARARAEVREVGPRVVPPPAAAAQVHDPQPGTSAESQPVRERPAKRKRPRGCRGGRKHRKKTDQPGETTSPRSGSPAPQGAERGDSKAAAPASLAVGTPNITPFCPVCQQRVGDSRLRRHIEARHLPWWIAPDRACWSCRVQESSISRRMQRHGDPCPPAMTEGNAGQWTQLCNGILRYIRHDLGCRDDEALLEYIREHRYYPTDASPFVLSMAQRVLFRLWERRNNLRITPLEEFSVQPPSTTSVLLHPKVLACVIPHLNPQTIHSILTLNEPASEDRLPRPRHVQTVVDAHIHIDRWGTDFRRQLGDVEDCNLRYQYLICNYVFPNRWNQWDNLQPGSDVYATFGIHPRICADESITEMIPELRWRLLSARCVALGEVGVDFHYRTSPRQRERQLIGLEAQIRARPTDMPIVLHCRGDGALEACLEVLSRRLRSDTVIQVHCFLGGPSEVERWTQVFPSCMFSFGHRSLTLRGEEAEHHRRAARGLRLDQILLESDAPYLSRSQQVIHESPGPASPRMDLFLIGRWIGQQRGLCPSVILEAARLNALRVFSLPGM